jgi:hypothetical protein
VDVRRVSHRYALRALPSINPRKLGRWMRTDRPMRAAFSSPLLTYLQSVV